MKPRAPSDDPSQGRVGEDVTLLGGVATPSRVVECARSYIGTPYHDFGRVKGVGADCIGLPVMVAEELGLFRVSLPSYSPTPRARGLEPAVEARIGQPVWTLPGWEAGEVHLGAGDDPLSLCAPAHLGMFWVAHRREPTHFALFASHPELDIPTMIHADARVGRVVEQSVDAFWTKRLVKVYRLPGVSY